MPVGQTSRRAFIAALSGAAAWPLIVRAEQGERVRRVGVVMNGNENDPLDWGYVAAFLQALAGSMIILALATIILAISTIALWRATLKLWRTTRDAAEAESRKTQLLERAYISVEPDGLHPPQQRFEGRHVLIGRVRLRNVGHMPAQKVRQVSVIEMEKNSQRKIFPVQENQLEGMYAILPGTEIIHETGSIDVTDQPGNEFIFVFGMVSYDDGFGNLRSTRFCHRYSRAALRKAGVRFHIPVESARFHEQGNHAN